MSSLVLVGVSARAETCAEFLQGGVDVIGLRQISKSLRAVELGRLSRRITVHVSTAGPARDRFERNVLRLRPFFDLRDQDWRHRALRGIGYKTPLAKRLDLLLWKTALQSRSLTESTHLASELQSEYQRELVYLLKSQSTSFATLLKAIEQYEVVLARTDDLKAELEAIIATLNEVQDGLTYGLPDIPAQLTKIGRSLAALSTAAYALDIEATQVPKGAIKTALERFVQTPASTWDAKFRRPQTESESADLYLQIHLVEIRIEAIAREVKDNLDLLRARKTETVIRLEDLIESGV